MKRGGPSVDGRMDQRPYLLGIVCTGVVSRLGDDQRPEMAWWDS